MNCITSKLLDGAGVTHGFGMAGYSLGDYLAGLNIKGAQYFQTNQLHSDQIRSLRFTDHNLRFTVLEADAFITCEAGVVCYVRTADCVPILLYDPVKKASAAVHAGWRGTALRLVEKTIEKLESEFGSRRGDILAAIGPAISGACFEVDSSVAEGFVTIAGEHLKRKDQTGKWHIDLQNVNRLVLEKAGVQNVEIVPVCNHCDKRFASFRRDKTETFRQVNFILSN